MKLNDSSLQLSYSFIDVNRCAGMCPVKLPIRIQDGDRVANGKAEGRVYK